MPGHEDCDLVHELRDAAAAVLDPAHETIVAETNTVVELIQELIVKYLTYVLKAKGISCRRYVTTADATCLNDPVIILKQSESRMVAFIADCPCRQQLEMKQNK